MMLAKEKHSVRIRLSNKTNDTTSPLYNLIYNVLISVMLLTGIFGALINTLYIPANLLLLIAAGSAIIIFSAFFDKNATFVFKLLVGIVAISLMIWALMYKYIHDGLAVIYNSIIKLLSMKELKIMAYYQLNNSEGKETLAATLFLIPIVLIFSFIIYQTVKHSIFILPLITLIGFIAVIYYFDYSANGIYFFLIIISCYATICSHFFRLKNLSLVLVPITIIMLIFMGIASVKLPEISLYFSNKKNLYSDSIHEKLFEPVKNPLPEGNLNKLQSFNATDDIALTVKGSKISSMYIRGYVGEKLKNGRWVGLSGAELIEQQQLLYKLHKNDFYPQTQLSYISVATRYNEESDYFKVKMELNNACKSHNYDTYGMLLASSLKLDKLSLDDRTVNNINPDDYKFYMLNNGDVDFHSLERLYYTLKENPSSDLKEYIENENLYKSFVYSNYLDLEDSQKAVFAKYLEGDPGEPGTHMAYENLKEYVKETVQKNITYSNTIDDKFLGTAEDIEKVFTSKIKGYSVHYATLAALMFRYYGVPTRYVEGFVLDTVNEKEGHTYVATMKNSHAWFEYYVDGLGWVPFEVTPGFNAFYGVNENNDKNHGGSDYKDFKNPNEYSKDPEEKKDEPPEEIVINLTLVIGILIALLIILWFVIRYLIISTRNKAFKEGKANYSSIYICKYLMKLLNAQDINQTNSSFFSVLPQIKEKFGEDLANDAIICLDTAYKAKFSNIIISEEERNASLDIYNNFILEAKKTKKNLIFKYIKWLY